MANSRAYTLAGFTLLFFLGILGTLFFLADLRRLGDVISHLDTRHLALAAVVTMISYFLNYLAFQGLARAVECRLGSADLFRIAFASATVSSLFSAGGVSGMTLRLYFLRRQGIRTHTTLIISLVSTMLNNVVLLMFVVAGFGRLLINGNLSGLQQLVSGLILLLSALAVVAAFLGLYHRGVLDLARRGASPARSHRSPGWGTSPSHASRPSAASSTRPPLSSRRTAARSPSRSCTCFWNGRPPPRSFICASWPPATP
jgi:uncharacterized membrane protein YbhN (UPF0104 family)